MRPAIAGNPLAVSSFAAATVNFGPLVRTEIDEYSFLKHIKDEPYSAIRIFWMAGQEVDVEIAYKPFNTVR